MTREDIEKAAKAEVENIVFYNICSEEIDNEESCMKKVEIVTKISVEVNLGGKPVNELLGEIADLCHDRLEYSTSKNEGCETLYEDGEYEDYRNDMEDRVSALEGVSCRILDLLED